MKRADMRDKIVSGLAGTSPMHPLRDSELASLVGVGMRFLAPALVELHRDGHVANRDVWPPGELPYKCYWRVAADVAPVPRQTERAISPYTPRDKGRDERRSRTVAQASSLPEDAGKGACATCGDGLAVPEKRARVRTCMCCRREFLSQGPHNRLCTPCRGKSVGPYDLS